MCRNNSRGCLTNYVPLSRGTIPYGAMTSILASQQVHRFHLTAFFGCVAIEPREKSPKGFEHQKKHAMLSTMVTIRQFSKSEIRNWCCICLHIFYLEIFESIRNAHWFHDEESTSSTAKHRCGRYCNWQTHILKIKCFNKHTKTNEWTEINIRVADHLTMP